ncbi:hypothetical protein [Bacillus infantis]|uniref:hypothetical protein n=1 Tax=Bacillus infantis TaxID=324767 RepID=UPI003CF0F8B9
MRLKILNDEDLFSYFSVGRNVAFIYILDGLNLSDLKKISIRLGIDLDITDEKLYKVFEDKKEMVNFVKSFRSEEDRENFYVCCYSNGKFVQENT